MVLTRPPVERGVDPREVAATARTRFARVEICDDPGEAIEQAGALSGDAGFVLVTGSLYLVGHVLGIGSTALCP